MSEREAEEGQRRHRFPIRFSVRTLFWTIGYCCCVLALSRLHNGYLVVDRQGIDATQPRPEKPDFRHPLPRQMTVRCR